MCLSEGLSGLAFVGPDIGGFAGDCDGELFTRWTQIGALLPFFRAHTAYGTQRQEPWSFGERYEAICRRFIELRYELLPYLYTAFWQCATTGLPMMRPLVMAYQDDPAACDLDDEFLLGDAILAAPVCEPGVVTRSVHLPRGTWYNFWSGNIFDGGRAVQVEASLEMMPIFVRAGSVVPLGPVMQFVGERLCEPLTLRVYPGEGESLLYEDDGESFDYQSGAYQLTRFTCRGSAEAIELRIKREGAFAAACRRFNVVIYGVERQPKAVVIDGEDIGEWEYDGTAKTVRFMCGLAEHIVIRV
jgi:alpha-glucosidase